MRDACGQLVAVGVVCAVLIGCSREPPEVVPEADGGTRIDADGPAEDAGGQIDGTTRDGDTTMAPPGDVDAGEGAGGSPSCREVCDRTYDECGLFLVYHDGKKVPKSRCLDICEWGYFIDNRDCVMNRSCGKENLNACLQPTPTEPDLSTLAPGSTWPESWAKFERQVFALVNLHRQRGVSCGDTSYDPTPPLEWNTAVRDAARSHSLDMANNDFYGHRGSDGSLPSQRLAEAGCEDCQGAGEGINRTFSTPFDAVRSWLKSEPHCKRMVSPQHGYTDFGAGYVHAPEAQYSHLWTINYTTTP